MSSPRILLRSTRAVRTRPSVFRQQINPIQRRPQSSNASASSNPNTGHALRTAIFGGLAGGTFAFLLGYTWYSMSGAKALMNTAHATKQYYETTKKNFQGQAPAPSESLKWLRQQLSFYASFIPGGSAAIDTTFNDLDTIRSKHGPEVDQILKEAHSELRELTNKDLSVSTASEAWAILQKYLTRITDLASDSAEEILSNHPELQSKLGTSVSQLRSISDSLGDSADGAASEAKNLLKDTWSQMSEIIRNNGVTATSISKLQSLLQEKTEKVKQLGEKAWEAGMKEAKPYLEKLPPRVKEQIESNKSALLRSGNVKELWERVKKAAEKGGDADTGDLEKYVDEAVKTVKEKSS